MRPTELSELESKGAAQVLREIAAGAHGSVGSPLREEVEAWLRAKEVEAAVLASSRRDAREEETLSIARRASSAALEANEIARRANRSAITAAILASAATLISAVIAAIIGVMYASK